MYTGNTYLNIWVGRIINNKMLINNSLCFAIRVVYIKITMMWDIRYIDEGFLIWVILSMYLSYEAVIWAVLLVLSYLFLSGFYLVFQFYYYYYYIIYIFMALPPVYYFIDLLLLPYCIQLISCLILHLYYCAQPPDLLIHWFIRILSYCIISWWFILFSS